jgi:putative MATE family efflux protein
LKDNKYLSTEPVGKLLFRLSVPTILAQLINMLYNIVDRIYIGYMPDVGKQALTGVGVCMPLIMIVSAFAALTGSGGAPRASIFMGKGDNDSAEKTMGGCFGAQIIVSAILTGVLLVFGKEMLLKFGASNDTIGFAHDYMSVYAVGTLFVQLTLGMNAYITAQGFSGIGMISTLIGAVLNIALDPLFIYGFDMGVRGAALATVISQAASCLWIVSFLCSKRSILKLRLKNILPLPKIVLPCFALGLAHFVMQASESVIVICFNSSLQQYGSDLAVGAMTILTSVMQFAMLPLQGLAQGSQPIIGYNFGARLGNRVKQCYGHLLTVSLCYSFAVWALIMIFPSAFASIFTPDKELIAFTANALRVYCAALCLFGIQIACQMTFVSLGRAGESVIVAVMRKFVLLLPLIFLLPSFIENKTFAIYLAEPIADVIAVSFTAALFYFRFKKALKTIE